MQLAQHTHATIPTSSSSLISQAEDPRGSHGLHHQLRDILHTDSKIRALPVWPILHNLQSCMHLGAYLNCQGRPPSHQTIRKDCPRRVERVAAHKKTLPFFDHCKATAQSRVQRHLQAKANPHLLSNAWPPCRIPSHDQNQPDQFTCRVSSFWPTGIQAGGLLLTAHPQALSNNMQTQSPRLLLYIPIVRQGTITRSVCRQAVLAFLCWQCV